MPRDTAPEHDGCDDADDGDDATFAVLVDRPLGPTLRRHVLTVAPGQTADRDDLDWRGALIVVRDGVVELHGLHGACVRFDTGSLLCLEGLPGRLHNPGSRPAVLVAVRRHHPDNDSNSCSI